MRYLQLLFIIAIIAGASQSALGQFKKEEKPGGIKLGKETIQRLRIGIIVKAQGGNCVGIRSTVPIPTAWPEQIVTIVKEEKSSHVRKIKYRTIGGTVKQLVVDIPKLNSGDVARALVTVEIRRRTILPPEKTDGLVIPKKAGKELRVFLAPSPLIESTNRRIRSEAKKIIAEKEGAWEKVETIYDWVRGHVEYKNGPIKGALKAYNDKTGDCEELTSLFIAMCRANKIPARTIWVPGHCYPEFYLEDEQGVGHWFPCQAAGDRSFGGISEQRPILQKGDNFRDPDRPRKRMRYLSPFLKGSAIRGSGKPTVKFIREELAPNNATKSGS